MLGNYFKVAWRNLLRNKGYSIVNILGLAVGLACFMFIALYVIDETSYDKFHEDSDQIYRVALDRQYPGRVRQYAIIPHSYAAVMQSDLPEVESSMRMFFFGQNRLVVKIGENLYEEEHVMWADSNFFDFFSIALLQGDERTALVEPNTVVLTESIAQKYFGTNDVIGREIDLPQANNTLMVTGVCEDVPENSHLQFDLLQSSETFGFLQQPNYINFSAYTYLKLVPKADPSVLESKFPDLVTKYISGQMLERMGIDYAAYQAQGNGYHYYLQPLEDIYLTSNLESEIKTPGSMQRVKFFTLIAFLIIGIASINFMNLSTARSAGRAREVGIRKTLGSNRNQITMQFMAEAVLIGVLSGLVAWGLCLVLIDQFNILTGKNISASTLLSPGFILSLLGLSAITGALSGLYPSFALSSFKPIQVLRGKIMSRTSGLGLRNALVVFQFSISVFLIISTILIYQQWIFTLNKELGYDKTSVINLQGAGGFTFQQSETFKNRISDLPGVLAVGGCNTRPGGQYFGISFKVNGQDEVTAGSGVMVDEGYIDCMEMEIVEGRSFSDEFMDTLSIIINEAAVREMNLTSPIGTQVVSNDGFMNPDADNPSVYTIVGVARDFHFQSLHHIISPLFFVHNQRNPNSGVDPLVTIKMMANTTPNTLSRIEDIWMEMQPDIPFRYTFLDRDWAQLYETESTTRRVSSFFSLVAIFIACLGLLALAAFTAERRTKEIGIRKVLGASVLGIVGMLSKDFLKLVIVGIVIASPIAWWVMNGWLENFAYRIEIGWVVFVLAAVIAIVIAFLTVSLQSVKAALANPIRSLRSE